MAKFLTGNELNTELEKIFEYAEERIILISPYIKLHDRYASTLKTKKENHRLQIIIVFGKNEDDLSRSMKQEDFNFFKEFPNIEIRYEKRLHAKYYSSEQSAILTSMNLYSFSQDNNIEAGVMTKATLLGNIATNIILSEDTFDQTSVKYFSRVIHQSDLLFKKVPEYESVLLGLTKKYKSSKIEVDKLSDFFGNKTKNESLGTKETLKQKTIEQNLESVSKRFNSTEQCGFCIRTGKEIQFNVDKPFTNESFQSWSKFSNEEYPEKFCHFSGEKSNGETSKSKPILKNNWKKAKEVHNL